MPPGCPALGFVQNIQRGKKGEGSKRGKVCEKTGNIRKGKKKPGSQKVSRPPKLRKKGPKKLNGFGRKKTQKALNLTGNPREKSTKGGRKEPHGPKGGGKGGVVDQLAKPLKKKRKKK